jgi:hypothetical protein
LTQKTFQVTIDQIWDWQENVQAGIDTLEGTYRGAPTFVKKLRASSQFKALVTALNKQRLAQKFTALTVTIPNFTATERIEDAIRGYNGYAGHDPIAPSLQLHEFRLARDTHGHLRLKLLGRNKAEAIWEEVPVADRPKKGDPNYVTHVLTSTF